MCCRKALRRGPADSRRAASALRPVLCLHVHATCASSLLRYSADQLDGSSFCLLQKFVMTACPRLAYGQVRGPERRVIRAQHRPEQVAPVSDSGAAAAWRWRRDDTVSRALGRPKLTRKSTSNQGGIEGEWGCDPGCQSAHPASGAGDLRRAKSTKSVSMPTACPRTQGGRIWHNT